MNDLNRLLDDAVPEPHRALSADDLVRRARRRRATRTAALGAVTAVALVAGVAVANGATNDPDRPPLAATLSPEPTGKPTLTPATAPATTPTQVRWPEDMGTSLVRCVSKYPAGLADMRVAFAGTVTDVRYGAIPKEGPTPVEIDFAVERAYGRDLGATVTLHTFVELLPVRSYGLDGTRVLAATDHVDEPSPDGRLSVRACGFTRTYRPEDAAFWERVFEPSEYVCRISSEGQSAGRDAREYVGMHADDAVALAQSRGLTARMYGDTRQGIRRDRRLDRVNLCDREGVVVAAAIF